MLHSKNPIKFVHIQKLANHLILNGAKKISVKRETF